MAKVKRVPDSNSSSRISQMRKLLKNHKEFEEKQRNNDVDLEKTIEQTKKWCTVYRRNWELYVMMELDIPLKEFQQIELHNIGVSDTFFSFSSRGTSKTFKGAAAAVTECLLYPHSEIIVSSTTIRTANKFVHDKIEDELCGRMSPKLRYFVKNKLITFTYSDEACVVNFFNKSWIRVLAESDSSVGSRITSFYAEEARRSKLSIIDRVFLPMRHARNPEFKSNLNHPEYAEDDRLVEKSKTVYLTSMAYKFEPIWKRWVSVVENAFNLTNEALGVYDFMIVDVYAALKHNFISVAEYTSAKATSSPMEFAMEYLNHSPVEGDGAFYELKMFLDNCVLKNAFYPPDYIEWLYDYDRGEKPFFRAKKKDETRVVYVDFAFVDDAKNDNDLTVIGCMSGYPDSSRSKILRNVDYITTYSGGKKEESLKKIRELFFFYEADYLIIDIRNGGSDRIQDLSKPFYHPELDKEMKGLGLCLNESLTKYFYKTDKINQLSANVVDPDALPVIIPVAGTDERNDSYHRIMRDALNGNKIRLLEDTTNFKRRLSETDDDILFNSEQLAAKIMPHLQTELLIQEAVQLEKKIIKGAYVKLMEVGSNVKDRIIATEYANYLFHLLELQMERDNIRDDDFELDDDFQLIF